MKKFIIFTIILFTVSASIYSAETLKPRIAVFPLINPSKDTQIEIISENVKKTAELTLKMIDRYEVIDTSVTDYSDTPQDFRRYTEENSIDSVIFGKADIHEDGSILIEMSVFSRGENSIIMTESETAETVFDIFDASDRLLISMMEEFSGMEHIGFGSIKLANSGENGKYNLYIDNVLIGGNIEELPKVLNGNRVLRIEQNRMFGPYILIEESFFLKEDEAKMFDFSVPGFTDDELSKITALESFIDENWDEKYSSKKIDKNFERLEELFTVTDYSLSASDKRAEVLEKKEKWQIRKKEWGLESGLTILDKRLGIGAYGGGTFSFPEFDTSDANSDQKHSSGKKYGASLSLNILPYLAVQTEYNYVEYTADIDRIATLDTLTIEMTEIPVMLLLRMPNKVMSAYGGISFLSKKGDAVLKIQDNGSDLVTTVDEGDPGVEIAASKGTAYILGTLFEIPLRKTYILIDFRYTKAEDDWFKYTSEDLIPKYFSMTAGLGLKFF